MPGLLTLLTAGTWVAKKDGSPWYVDGRDGDWDEPLIKLVCKVNGHRMNVPLKEFGKSWNIVPDENGIKGNPTGQIVGAFNASA